MLPRLNKDIHMWFSLSGEQSPTMKQKLKLFTFLQVNFTVCIRNN